MSYILDALRRSQAERERGEVPGLHDQALPAALAPAAARRGSALWLVAVLALIAAMALMLRLWPRQAQISPAAVALSAPSPSPPGPSAPPAPAPAVSLPQVVSAPAASAAPPAMPTASAAPLLLPKAATRMLSLDQLTPQQRREWPPLAIGGSIWSENKASRFVIINGQLLREGERVAPGLVLERIAPKSIVLGWRDLSVEVPL